MTPTNTEALAAELEQQRISNWIHSTGTPPRVSGTKPDPLCQKAAAELRRLLAENRALQRKLQEQALLQALTDSTENAELLAERDALRSDAERLNWLEEVTHRGYAPQVVYDDNGNWAVSFDGVMPVPQADPPDEPLMVSARVEPHEWEKTARAAIDAARAAMKGTQ